MSKFSITESASPVLIAIERAKRLIEAEKAKAPTVMTRSGITDLANRVRQSEGQYGAQRVERAADEIPNLEKLYQDQALMRAFTGDNAQGLMTMKPSDFERYAAPLDANLSGRSLQKIADITGFHNNGGFSDVPYLNINKMQQGSTGLPYISGHEGRHRSRVMDAAGEQAGLVQLVPRSELREPFPRRSREDYLEALYKEMQLTGNRVKPQRYDEPVTDSADRVIELRSKQRPTIELPEFYAEGGMITDQQTPAVEALKQTVQDDGANKMLNLDLAKLAIMHQPQRMAGGGVLHMSKAGSVTDMAVAVEKAKRKLSAEAVERAAQRALDRASVREREEAEGYYHPIGGGNKLTTPTSQMSAEYAPTAGVNMTPQQTVNPEKIVGGASVPLGGDAALGGVDLIGINGRKLSAPVTLQAGESFSRQNPGEGWRSHQNVISLLDNRMRDAYGLGADNVYGAYTSMGPIAGDFNHMTTQALLRQFDPKTFKKAFEFNNDVRTLGALDPNTGAMVYHGKDFVGLQHPDLEKQLMDYGSGNLRKVFLNRAQMARYQREGMPDVASTRYGVNDPTMLNTPIGTVGRSISQFPRADRQIISSQYPPHGSYPAGLYGDYVGGLEHPVSYKDWFHTFFDPRVAKNESPANENFAFMRSTPIQLHTQQWLDRVMGSIKKQQDALKLGTYAEGGAVHMEDGGDVELPTGGLSTDVGTNPLSIYNQNLPKPEMRLHARRKTAPDGEPSTMDVARQLGMMAKEQAGEEWDTLKANPVRGALDILNRGMVAGNVGAPVDIVNMGLQGVNYLTKKAGLGGDWASEKPVMGSKWIEDKMNELGITSDKHYPMLELAANFLNPVGITAGAAKAAPVIGKNVLMPLAEKGLTMFEKGQLTPGFKPISEVFAGSTAKGADLAARDTAKARLAAGEDPALVWKETGWAAPPWAPNDLRFEISDHAMTSNAPAAVNAKLDAHSRKLANVYYAQEIKRNVASGDAFDDAVVKAEATVKNAGLKLPMTPEAEALARDPNVTRAELVKEFDKGKVKKISTIGKLSGKLDKFVDHDEFFAAYPDFAQKIKFKTLNAKETNRLHGSFSPSDAELSMSAPQLRSKPNDALDTIIHELQHGVQSRERWNNGGNSSSVTAYPSNYDPVTAQSKQQLTDMMVADNGRLGDLYRKGQTTKLSPMEIQELNHRIRSTPEYSKYQKDALTFRQSDTPYALYERLAGEAEARLAQGRRTLKPNERQDQYPYDPQHFKKLTGYDINSIIANPVRAANNFSKGGAASHPSVEEMRIEMMERKHG